MTASTAPFASMRERDVSLRGLRFRLCEWGPHGGPLVVLLHGWLDQGAAWDAVAAQLAQDGYWVVAPDHRGHGRSDWTPTGSTYHFLEYVADLDALMQRLEADAPGMKGCTLVGHSMGGTIATLYAGLRPERIASLVLVDGLGPPAVSDDEAADQATTFLEHCRSPRIHRVLVDVSSAADRIRRTNPGLSRKRAEWLAKRVTVVLPGGGVKWRWDPLHRTRAAVAFDADRLMAVIRRVQCATWLVVGCTGWYARLPALLERQRTFEAGCTRVDLPCGHDIHHSEPQRLVSVIRQAVRFRS